MFIDYINDGKFIYFMMYKIPIIVKMDNESGRIVAYKKAENSSGHGLFNRVIDCGGEVLFVPSHANEFLFVNKKNLEIERIPIPMIEISKRNFSFFSEGFLWNDKVYALGLSYPGILRASIATKEMKLIVDLRNYKCEELVSDNCIVDDCVYIPFKEDNRIIKFNFTTESIDILQTEDINACQAYKAIAFDGNVFWLVSNNDLVIRFDKDFKFLDHVTEVEKLISDKGLFKCIYYEGDLYMFFMNVNVILKFSLQEENDYTWIPIPCEKNGMRPIYYASLKASGPCFYSESVDCFFYINKDDKTAPYDPIKKQEYLNMVLDTDGVVMEMSGVGIEDYLRCLKYE